MSGLLNALSWLLLALLWVQLLTFLARPGPRRPVPQRSPSRGAATGPRTAPPSRTVPSPREEVTHLDATPPLPAPRPAVPRTSVLLLGADADDLAGARASAARHVGWLGGERTARGLDGGLTPDDVASARLVVLGSGAAAYGTGAALAASAATGVPVLVTAAPGGRRRTGR